MSLLTIVQNACDRIGLPRPALVINGSSQTARAMLAISNAANIDLSRFPWEALRKEATFLSVAAEDQGAMTTIAPGYRFMIGNTIWNRTQQRPIPGVMSAQKWQRYKSSLMAGPYSEFCIRGGHILFKPIPAAGNTIAFEYQSGNWCQSAGGTGQAAWAADSDTGVLNESLMESDIVWRYLRSRGLSFDVEYKMFAELKNILLGQDNRSPTLDMSPGGNWFAPIGVPEGNWNL